MSYRDSKRKSKAETLRRKHVRQMKQQGGLVTTRTRLA